ncbi:MAG: hypothetical protein CVV64_14770 [Candidatus Wallbacteria bacterium HGW-Wallbacteria-1]|jgi:proteasome accessory factor A|uniref:Pup--protein ligase n=1 Tax=Candidatus Wallbacteria bacterium HGW-Wallbacteria-1 TaxID=2013854 RepID=A0A2N1PLV1_9BACT|nr:MAG: hypothetical protein CVV64_14770 [Candidatus Wallbacteria bacterium HGW-Wallbacteria-1]
MKKRIFGLETEYAVIPGSPGSQINSFNLFNLLQWAVSLSCRTARAAYRKIGFFLENGSLVNYEARASAFLDSRIFESATCECTSPREVVTYQRAVESILLESMERVKSLFPDVGNMNLSKSSVDWAGNTFGCHENYFVQDRMRLSGRILNTIALGLYSIIFTVFIILNVISFIFSVCWLIYFCLTNMRAIIRTISRRSKSDRENSSSESNPESDFIMAENDPFARIEQSMAWQMAWWETIFKIILGPLVKPYSWLVTRANFTDFTMDLTSHLISRILFCGSGHVTDSGQFTLSQKRQGINKIAAVYFDEPLKPVFDFKFFLFSPFSCFSSWKQLQIMFSDSNMCQYSEYLKVGTTAMVIEMIEEGQDLSFLRLDDPLSALSEMNSPEGLFKPLKMASGESLTALEIQEKLLLLAREMIKRDKVAPFWAREILDSWEGVLRDLRLKGPVGLADRIDWAVKYVLVRNVMSPMDPETISKYIPLVLYLERVGIDSTRFTVPIDEMPEPLRPLAREHEKMIMEIAGRAGVDPGWTHAAARAYFGARKIDFRFHDLNPGRGYQRGLEDDGYLLTLIKPSEVEVARCTPPAGTRAAVRGYYIRRASETVRKIKAGWRKVKLYEPSQTASLSDPYQFKPPFEV